MAFFEPLLAWAAPRPTVAAAAAAVAKLEVVAAHDAAKTKRECRLLFACLVV